jgi:hypothetical protein
MEDESTISAFTENKSKLDGSLVVSCEIATIMNSGFSGCTNLISVYLPSVITIDDAVFNGCTALTSIDLPVAQTIGYNAFGHCTALTSIDLPQATTIDDAAFYCCTALDTIILRNPETVCAMNVLAMINTKILTEEGMPIGEGFVYVPAALYEDYVANFTEQVTVLIGDAATAEYMSRSILRKIEDYPEICG